MKPTTSTQAKLIVLIVVVEVAVVVGMVIVVVVVVVVMQMPTARLTDCRQGKRHTQPRVEGACEARK